jgi:hypothetical protein
MNIVFPSDTTEVIDGIRFAIGRLVDFITPTYSGCSVCTLNPITNESTDSFCPVCSGMYWIETDKITSVSGFVTWKPDGILNWVSAGKLFEGDCAVQIKYTPENVALAKTDTTVLVDGKEMQVFSVTPRGVPEINRLIIALKER